MAIRNVDETRRAGVVTDIATVSVIADDDKIVWPSVVEVLRNGAEFVVTSVVFGFAVWGFSWAVTNVVGLFV
ncbi:MAG: hypothetical protein KH433_00750 [Campylobacter concisus]|nr:hypothetical protein [Campylobacter concisus]